MIDNKEIAKNDEPKGNILLPDDKPFLITRIGSDFSKDVNITYRWPRKVGESILPLVATSTLDAGKLNKLRVEELDGQYFVTNDTQFDALKICVESEEIGHLIIKAVIDEFVVKESAETKEPEDDLELPKEYWRLNKIAENSAPLIFTSCGILLSVSAAFWLIFK